jgi:hypothetical protein
MPNADTTYQPYHRQKNPEHKFLNELPDKSLSVPLSFDALPHHPLPSGDEFFCADSVEVSRD